MYNLGQSGRARPRRPSLFNVPQKHQLLLLAVRAGSICLSVHIMFFVCVFFSMWQFCNYSKTYLEAVKCTKITTITYTAVQ